MCFIETSFKTKSTETICFHPLDTISILKTFYENYRWCIIRDTYIKIFRVRNLEKSIVVIY